MVNYSLIALTHAGGGGIALPIAAPHATRMEAQGMTDVHFWFHRAVSKFSPAAAGKSVSEANGTFPNYNLQGSLQPAASEDPWGLEFGSFATSPAEQKVPFTLGKNQVGAGPSPPARVGGHLTDCGPN